VYILSYAIEVNPIGTSPVLSVQQVWRGLEMKAENAVPFVPGMTRCEVISRKDNTLLREITIPTGDFRELITFYAPVQVHFERVGGGGFIQNTITESERGLLLTFTFGLSFPGTQPGSKEEHDKGESMRNSYISAIVATLHKVRELVSKGDI